MIDDEIGIRGDLIETTASGQTSAADVAGVGAAVANLVLQITITGWSVDPLYTRNSITTLGGTRCR